MGAILRGCNPTVTKYQYDKNKSKDILVKGIIFTSKKEFCIYKVS